MTPQAPPTEIPTGELVELLVALIRNRCVNDGTPASGQERRSVETLAGYLGAEGRVFEPRPGRCSVLYRVAGEITGAPRLMLNGHLDVVPAEPRGWSVDPFEGVRADGFVWGRGAVDMLGQTAVMAAVFKRFLDGDAEPLPGDLIFLAVADEEAAGRWGSGYLTEHHWDEVAAEYVITEMGAPMLTGRSGPGLPVTVAEKGPHWRMLRAAGIPGHGSQPYGTRNALAPVARAVAALAAAPSPVLVSEQWAAFVEAWDPPLAPALVDPARVDAAVEAIADDDPEMARWVHACTHMTVSPNTLQAGEKINTVPGSAAAGIDVRMLPGQTEAELDDHFLAVLGEDRGTIEIVDLESTPANGSPADGPLWEAIGAALQEVCGTSRLLPSLIPVATDARFFRRRGAVAYGFIVADQRIGFGEHLAMFHGDDERISEDSLRLTAAHLLATVHRFGEAVAS